MHQPQCRNISPRPGLRACPAVYSLVKFAGVTNYIVAVWTADALAACAILNLPCADIRPLVKARGLPEEAWLGQFVTWTRHIVAERVLAKGLVMHFMGEGHIMLHIMHWAARTGARAGRWRSERAIPGRGACNQ